MKTIILILILFTIDLSATGLVYTPNMPNHTSTSHAIAGYVNKPATGKIVIINPHHGKIFAIYDQINIKWRFAMGHIAQKCVSINLYHNNRHIKELTHRICRQNFKWKIPNINNLADGEYKFKISTVDGKISAFSQTFSISKADLQIVKNSFKISPKKPDMADFVKLNFTIKNPGKVKADSSFTHINIIGPDGKSYKIFSKYTDPIPSRGKLIVSTKSFPLSDKQYGKYRVNIKLNSRNNVVESNIKNNSISYSFYANPLPDLRVCIDTLKRPRYGKNVTIRAYIFNKGYTTSKPCDLKISVERTNHTYKNYKFRIPSIKSGRHYFSAHLRYKWPIWSSILPDKKTVYATLYYYFKAINTKNKTIKGEYYPTRAGGKHGPKNKVRCSWLLNEKSIDKSAVGIK